MVRENGKRNTFVLHRRFLADSLQGATVWYQITNMLARLKLKKNTWVRCTRPIDPIFIGLTGEEAEGEAKIHVAFKFSGNIKTTRITLTTSYAVHG